MALQSASRPFLRRGRPPAKGSVGIARNFTPSAALRGMEQNLHPVLSIRIFAEEKCFGPGVAALLNRIHEHHSLRAAAMSMGMAYSKAWTILRAAETGLGFKLLNSTTGGKHGGGATLTTEAEAILAAYERYCAELRQYASALFETHFHEFLR